MRYAARNTTFNIAGHKLEIFWKTDNADKMCRQLNTSKDKNHDLNFNQVSRVLQVKKNHVLAAGDKIKFIAKFEDQLYRVVFGIGRRFGREFAVIVSAHKLVGNDSEIQKYKRKFEV